MDTARYEIRKVIRRADWHRMTNRRGGAFTMWLVCDLQEQRIASEHFTRRSARAWVAAKTVA